MQAVSNWTAQRADASTVEALQDIAHAIVIRLNSNTLDPGRALSALNALKDVDMSLELLELSPIATAISAVAEADDDSCMMTEARRTAQELLENWKEAARQGVVALESKVKKSEQRLEKIGIKASSH